MRDVSESGEYLMGKRYIPETGEYISMACYAILGADSRIQDVITTGIDAPVPMSAISIPFADKSIIGHLCINGDVLIPGSENERLYMLEVNQAEILDKLGQVLVKLSAD